MLGPRTCERGARGQRMAGHCAEPVADFADILLFQYLLVHRSSRAMITSFVPERRNYHRTRQNNGRVTYAGARARCDRHDDQVSVSRALGASALAARCVHPHRPVGGRAVNLRCCGVYVRGV
jgi:hypothetical protein